MKEKFASLGVFGMIVLVILAFIFSPLLTIWVLNTLFVSLAIPYTFWTWLAAMLLNLTISALKK